jgi:hypothetical protein
MTGNAIRPTAVSTVGTNVINHAFSETVADGDIRRPRHGGEHKTWRTKTYKAPAAEGFPSRDDRDMRSLDNHDFGLHTDTPNHPSG